jgi:hypothetical protein
MLIACLLGESEWRNEGELLAVEEGNVDDAGRPSARFALLPLHLRPLPSLPNPCAIPPATNSECPSLVSPAHRSPRSFVPGQTQRHSSIGESETHRRLKQTLTCLPSSAAQAPAPPPTAPQSPPTLTRVSRPHTAAPLPPPLPPSPAKLRNPPSKLEASNPRFLCLSDFSNTRKCWKPSSVPRSLLTRDHTRS